MSCKRTIALGLALILAPASAIANPSMEVASAFDTGDGFDLNASIAYSFAARRSAIKREFVGFPGTDPEAPVPLVKDLLFSSARHTITPKLELGIFTDLWLSAALPIIIRDNRSLRFDQRSTPCVFPGAGDPTCINAANSSTVQDGILPESGFDAQDPTGPGFTGATLFRGVTRAGLDQVHLGIGWAPMNAERDPTKPTWKVEAKLLYSVGKIMHFERSNPSSAKGISRGVHEIEVGTSMAKRVTWAIPHFELYWRAPIGTRRGSPLEDLDRPFGADSQSSQQIAGTRFGFEAIPWERPADDQRVGIDLTATIEGHFEGRDTTEMWEVFQYAGDSEASGPLVLDSDPPGDGLQALDHPGASNIENYLAGGLRVGVDAQIGPKVHFGAAMSMFFEQNHLITFANPGNDLPTCTGGENPACEETSNSTVDPNSKEVNPLYRELIDLAGRRYRVDEVRVYSFFAHSRFLF